MLQKIFIWNEFIRSELYIILLVFFQQIDNIISNIMMYIRIVENVTTLIIKTSKTPQHWLYGKEWNRTLEHKLSLTALFFFWQWEKIWLWCNRTYPMLILFDVSLIIKSMITSSVIPWRMHSIILSSNLLVIKAMIARTKLYTISILALILFLVNVALFSYTYPHSHQNHHHHHMME